MFHSVVLYCTYRGGDAQKCGDYMHKKHTTLCIKKIDNEPNSSEMKSTSKPYQESNKIKFPWQGLKTQFPSPFAYS